MTERLFEDPAEEAAPPLAAGQGAPLAARMRPRTLGEFVGHAHVRALLDGELSSVILWGPPGSGKTSLAAVIGNATGDAWEELSAVSDGVKDVRRVIEAGRERLDLTGRHTILFIDEIHRFNKAQQDALLPGVERGWIRLVGATTENPFFELTAPLMSRCRLVRLEPLTGEDVREIVRRALADPERGYGGTVVLTEEAEDHLVAAADGDARTALVALEAAVMSTGGPTGTAGDGIPRTGAAGVTGTTAAGAPTGTTSDAATADALTSEAATGGAPTTVALDDVVAALASKRLRYDKAGDQHYDQISAFIKSMRGSDPDAAVYWLCRMLDEGEDPRFLARRMVIFASEDVGLADRAALPTAVAAFEALDRVGLPEARHNLVHAALALATAPKSNAVARAMGAADRAIAEAGNAPVPVHLRDAHYRSARRIGHGEGYDYPHAHPGAFVVQQYLPDALVGRHLYDPTEHGDEAEVARRVAQWRALSAGAATPDADERPTRGEGSEA